jgi:hypothetical protein
MLEMTQINLKVERQWTGSVLALEVEVDFEDQRREGLNRGKKPGRNL